MSLLLAAVFGFFGFLLSFKGLFAILVGIVLFVMLPVVPLMTGEFKSFANLHIVLASKMLGRFAIVVSEHGDLLLKTMSYDDLGVEKISFADSTKDFSDPAGRLHYWMDAPFALANEKWGVLHDPRDAAIGSRKRDADERETAEYHATNAEWDAYGVVGWKRAVDEFQEGVYELVDLSGVAALTDGGERAEYPKRVEKLYEHSRLPFLSGMGAVDYLIFLAALVGPFGICWLLASQGNPNSGHSSVISFGLLTLLSTGNVNDVDYRRVGKALAVLLPLPLLFVVMFLFVSPFTAIFVFVTLGIGFWLLPLLTILVKPIGRLSEKYARLLFRLGLLGYDRPVLEWTPSKYQLREFDELEEVDSIKWYGLLGSLFGVTFEPSPDSWGAELLDPDEVGKPRAAADGGRAETNLPDDVVPAPSIRRTSSMAGFVPETVRDGAYWVSTAITWGKWRESTAGEKTLNRLAHAKEVHGGDSSLSDKTKLIAVCLSGGVSLVLGVVVFFL